MSHFRHRRIIALLALLLIGSVAGAQEGPRTRPFGEGTHTLRAILNKMKLQPITSEGQFRNIVRFGDPSEVLMIVLGDTDVLNPNRLPDGVDNFLLRGGAILVASDQIGGQWQQELGRETRVDGSFVQATQAASCYRDSKDCPYVRPLPSKNVPVFDGLTHVATNRPSFLRVSSACPLGILAIFPADCTPENTPAGLLRRPMRFAIGGIVGDERLGVSGRMLFMADHSVFSNDMMLQTDNDNFDLSWNALQWLTEHGKRQRVLFVDDGTVVPNFNVMLKEPPLPPLPGLPSEAELIRVAHQRLAEMERENLLNNLAVNALGGDKASRNLILGLVIIGTLGILAVAGLHLGRARHRIDPQLPVSSPELWHAPAETLSAQRQQALIQAGNFWEPARALARQFFETAAGCKPDSWASAGRRPPQITVADAGRQRCLAKELRPLWRLAASAVPYRVTAADFQRLTALLPVLQAECRPGTASV